MNFVGLVAKHKWLYSFHSIKPTTTTGQTVGRCDYSETHLLITRADISGEDFEACIFCSYFQK